ncbi:MAG: pentapeptide repeat-containing protein, partial [Spirochaetaceae bacterium]|nr:pentapeptide repeat-containing protein [Spirochaetaceae bacterium]
MRQALTGANLCAVHTADKAAASNLIISLVKEKKEIHNLVAAGLEFNGLDFSGHEFYGSSFSCAVF